MLRSERGFSLVELLVVLLLVAILLALLLPALEWGRRSAIGIQCAAQLRSIGRVMQLYRDDQSGRYPLADISPPVLASQATPHGPLPLALEPYLRRDDRAYRCPGDEQVFPRMSASGVPGISYNYWAGVAYANDREQSLFDRGLMEDFSGIANQSESFSPDPFHNNVNTLYPDNRVERSAWKSN